MACPASSWHLARVPPEVSPQLWPCCSSPCVPGLPPSVLPPGSSPCTHMPLQPGRLCSRPSLLPGDTQAAGRRHTPSPLASIKGSRQLPGPTDPTQAPSLLLGVTLLSQSRLHLSQIRNPGVLGHCAIHSRVLWDTPRVHIWSLCSTSASAFIADFITHPGLSKLSACQADLSRGT